MDTRKAPEVCRVESTERTEILYPARTLCHVYPGGDERMIREPQLPCGDGELMDGPKTIDTISIIVHAERNFLKART